MEEGMIKALRLLPLLLTLVSTPAAALPTMLDDDNKALRKAFTKDHPPEGLPSQEQRVLDRLNSNKQRKEEQKRRAFAADQKRWGKCYLAKQYDWMSWRKAANGTWVTETRFCHTYSKYSDLPPSKPSELVAVTCQGLKISTVSITAIKYSDPEWSEWKDPILSEKEMIVKLCSREET